MFQETGWPAASNAAESQERRGLKSAEFGDLKIVDGQ